MALSTHILVTHGCLVVFVWVLMEQFGVPVPSAPLLVAVGALSAEGQVSFPLTLLAGLVASLVADSTWFFIGRRYGHRALRFLCKLSFEPSICVSRTRDSFARHRALTLMFAKFVPGLAALATPVAGESGMDPREFLLFDGIGILFWLGTWLVVGRVFGDVIKRDPHFMDYGGRFTGTVLVVGILAFFAHRAYRFQMFRKELVANRVEPEDLKSKLDAGEDIYIVDLRHPLELLPEPFLLPGAHHIPPDTLTARHMEIPLDRDIVLYCTCPNEATAAKTAMALHRLGIKRVHPLRGGFEEWKRLGFPLDAVKPAD
jgi:membrane protein DedA with SNARE-associated domain/rhodanese-related sulfurtransferase